MKMKQPIKVYDFIIVGAGPAGCALATRLAQSPLRPTVLLLEAGGPNTDLRLRTESCRYAQFHEPSQIWGYTSTAHPSTANRSVGLECGKGLGGSSAINFTAWTEGCRDDYDRLARITGDEAWAWENAKRQFRGLTTHHCSVEEVGEELSKRIGIEDGGNGPLHIGYEQVGGVEFRALADRLTAECGGPIGGDANNGDMIGIGVQAATCHRGIRGTAADLLHGAPDNLVVVTNTPIHRVLFQASRAFGVLTLDGRAYQASKEVIISAGSLDSPKILMHSGIGPAAQLAQFDIPVLHDNANVGANFEDHIIASFPHIAKNPPSWSLNNIAPIVDDAARKAAHQSALREWELYRTGPIATAGNPMSLAFFKSDAVLKSAEYAALHTDIQDHIAAPTVPIYELALSGTSSNPFSKAEPDPTLLVTSIILHNLQSRGTFSLQSADPAVPLSFETGYLTHPFDVRLAIESTREVLRVLRREFFTNDYVSLPVGPKSDSDEDIIQFWRETVATCWHMSATCKMGKEQEQDDAVVDTEFKVFGVQGLRVVGNSILPFLLATHVQAAAYLTGLIAADKVIEQYGLAN